MKNLPILERATHAMCETHRVEPRHLAVRRPSYVLSGGCLGTHQRPALRFPERRPVSLGSQLASVMSSSRGGSASGRRRRSAAERAANYVHIKTVGKGSYGTVDLVKRKDNHKL